ncbi:GNAT family N-acetyltransferase [Salegentibacter mishustinae]|uniref:GNAT family N-acetyltransferase n=1 Tax=Salegentibacter mishustinae TaxID=270918 RepID=UPI001CE12A3D|nr:GNAT family N-acetyltransferase [Salegentibacter mishustinae]UBZ06850.1 GNAT family N-acetyltransferase [Salegentibacter mishustinae]
MQIREATSSDIPEIIRVLRASIGESKLPKKEEIWRYKHLDNPFGASLVLLAVESGRIVGVRSFMNWEWNMEGTFFSALRAVDTGVLPEYQGKGIFKKLNSAGLELAESRGKHFIFNTPNSKSLPANLKMGWDKMGKLKIVFIPGNFRKLISKKKNFQYRKSKDLTALELQELLDAYNNSQSKGGKIFTSKSPTYLQWRYEQNPLQEYEVISDKDFYLAAYLKSHKYFTELRVTEHIYHNQFGLDKIKSAIFKMNRIYRAELISYTSGLNLSYFKFSGKFGPVLVYRNLNLDPGPQNKISSLKNWSYTLGDLELF